MISIKNVNKFHLERLVSSNLYLSLDDNDSFHEVQIVNVDITLTVQTR